MSTPPQNISILHCTLASIGNTNNIAFQAATSIYNNIKVDGCYLSGYGANTDMCHSVTSSTNLTFTNNIWEPT